MAHLTTDFIKIAQVGPSIDGRFIREDWIRDMAATYDPKTYTAMVWPDHMRWGANYGEVLELTAGHDEKDALCLYARLRPNSYFLWDNAMGQKLFYSIEVKEDFAGTGKAYLEGLGVTDSPASLGMESTRFTARQKTPDTIFISNVALEPLSRPEKPDLEQQAGEEAPGWFRRLFPSLFTSDSGADTPEQKDNVMDEALETRLEALEGSLAALQGEVAAITDRLPALEPDEAYTEGKEGEKDKEDEKDEDAYKALAREFASLRKEMAKFTAEMRSAVKPGTRAPGNTGPAGGKALL